LRATYNRYHGTEQFLGFYDVHKDCLAGIIRKRKRIHDVLTAFKRLRKCYPRKTKIYLIMDNLPLHKSKPIEDYLDRNNIEKVWTPTYSSWLNIIESHFGIMKKFTLSASDDQDHKLRRRRIYRYLRLRNKSRSTHKTKLSKVFNH